MASKTLSIAATLLALATASTAAQAATTDWTGFYIGANAGQVKGKSNVAVTPVFSPTGYFAMSSTPAIASSAAGKVSPDSFGGGVTAGYNFQKGDAVFGVEFDYNTQSASDSRAAGGTYPCCAPTAYTLSETTKADQLMTLRGRLGLSAGNSLYYVTAGLGRTKLKVVDTFNDNFATAAESFAASKTKSATIWGVGYEYNFQNHWSLKAEYLRADFGSISGTSTNLTAFTPPIAFPTNTFYHSADYKENILRIGVNYRF
ncbi:MAG TPA: outer membrane beta-barrel protein [Arenimonas sp.]|uniref:outer membrane protein n=1 Tax=Arenimonas sp. TaxID=1872635 RepID=UPI002CEBD967|nr:outer membrane beta-barrel protein [Arenimonas sp.]HMB56763.1 outer membrane beta-barrel protein [Arenimonas sp.]